MIGGNSKDLLDRPRHGYWNFLPHHAVEWPCFSGEKQ